MSASTGSISGKFAERYTIERELGRGATSVVYLAHDLDHGRMVAIKWLRQELAESLAADRFLREIKLTAQLQHPNIVTVLASGVYNGRPYFALPYMDGGTLRERLQNEKQLAIEEVVRIGTTIAGALAFAHERNFLHRDVKPENILFTGGQACLSDFGIARALTRASDDSTTTTGMVRGTPAYMSPEQAAGEEYYDGRSDIYSLACVLYEALAGVPAFMGASSQIVLAQRMTHEPRPVGVYRPSVSAELESVLVKALAIAPADRYQTARDFAAALGRVDTTVQSVGATAARKRAKARKRRVVWGVAGVAVLAAASALAVNRDRVESWFMPSVTLDTTRVAVLPFEVAGGFSADQHLDDLLAEGLRRWRPLTLVDGFQVADAMRRSTTVHGDADVARAVGAGRYVRARIVRLGDSARLDASLVETRSGAVVHTTHLLMPAESALAVTTYHRVADSLLLRGERPTSGLDTVEVSGSLPATQEMIAAQSALRDWDLARAESLYAHALQLEPSATRAALWLAQLRAWQPSSRNDTWRALARQAADNGGSLGVTERQMASALALMANENYPAACAQYRQMTKQSPQSFVAWYGLASCLDGDQIVVADGRGGWRFRSSYQEAVSAYIRAFDLLPSAYRSYQGGAYSRLRRLLFTGSRYLRFGRSLDVPARHFTGRPVLRGDTMQMILQPLEQTQGGQTLPDPEDWRRSLVRSRALFRQIATGWASSLPQSPGAKEALAVALEIDGDPAAADTLRAAIRLTNDRTTRLRLLANLAWLEIKFATPSAPNRLVAVRALADSVLATADPSDVRQATFVAFFGTIAGRCDVVARAMQTSSDPIAQIARIPQRAAAMADIRLVLTVMGCPVSHGVASIGEIIQTAAIAGQPLSVQMSAQSFLLARILRFAEPLDTLWAAKLAPRDPVVAMRLFVERGAVDSARSRLQQIENTRRAFVSADIPPDAVLPNVSALLAFGDRATARQRLDSMFAAAKLFQPLESDQPTDGAVTLGSFIRAMRVRESVAADADDRDRWHRAAQALWPSDPSSFPAQKIQP
ncbi:MAG TPA: serine/threonine-protein kinase [Gemmatimonadaceae bacterium]|nr:serine/threonine-protein kinase [Gemmatimonadaceae bacterium]